MTTTAPDHRAERPPVVIGPRVTGEGVAVPDLTVIARALAVDRLVCDLALRRGLHDPHPQVAAYQAAFRVRPEGGDEITVGSAALVVLPRWDAATFDALDDLSWDLAAFARLLRRGYYEILTELRGEDPRESAAPTAAGVVLVDRVCVDPAWRGLRLGLLGTGLALRELRRGAAFALLYPMQPGLGADAERSASRRNLTRYWSELGFTRGYEQHLVLDLATDDLDDGLERLAREAGGGR